MHEGEVLEAISKWLGSLFPTSVIHTEDTKIEVYEIEDGYSIGYKMAYCILVECDCELLDFYKNLGQCVTSCIENGYVPTYLAVPDNYPHIERLERAMNAIKLPIGLITVNEKGEVKVAIKPHIP